MRVTTEVLVFSKVMHNNFFLKRDMDFDTRTAFFAMGIDCS